jgi:hypothetical protein
MMGAQLVLATLVQRVTFALVPGQRILSQSRCTQRVPGGTRRMIVGWSGGSSPPVVVDQTSPQHMSPLPGLCLADMC